MNLERFTEWRRTYLTDRQFTLILSFLVGLFAAVAAFVLHWLIKEIQMLLTSGFNTSTFNWMYLVYPVIGIYITSLFVRYVVKDNISHGITRILYAISSKRSRLKGHNCWSSVLASAITIGFGGSVVQKRLSFLRVLPSEAISANCLTWTTRPSCCLSDVVRQQL